MALEEFEKEEQSDRNKGYVLMKSIMDYGMGLLWMGMGVFLTFVKYFGEEFAQRFNDPWFKALGVVCIVYGAFRIYRGYKKNYFRER
ncbi:MAG TPA: hypothetical protein PK504_05520 [Ferruginibacter sp.]|nr:hypothetical protein [Ferruginibacter sp.]HRE63070.1 hypothetical protein [Ferruginibacter sp.]